jgi:hypothetical protein
VQDRLAEAETRENQSREEEEKAKADLFQVGLFFLFDIEYDLHALGILIFKIKSSFFLIQSLEMFTISLFIYQRDKSVKWFI